MSTEYSGLRKKGAALFGFAVATLAFGALAGSTGAATPVFRTIDLDTIGGRYSAAYATNDPGYVVGRSTTAGEHEEHAFFWTQAGGMLDLGTLGGRYSTAYAVNDTGQVVGTSSTSKATGSRTHAFSWTQAGGMIDLGTLGGTFSYANAVNDAGQVAGYSTTVLGYEHPFLWTKVGGMTDLGMLPGFAVGDCSARDLNDAGQVVGTCYAYESGQERAFSWTQAGGMVNLGTLGGGYTYSTAVNNAGQVVGASDTARAETHAFSWTKATGMTDLGTIGGGWYSSARAVNESGQVVGAAIATMDYSTHAFSWTKAGGMIDLGSIGGVDGYATAVNNAGQVVGVDYTEEYDPHAFSWTKAGGMIDLGTIGETSYAFAVGSAGQVAGYSSVDEGEHATLWRQPTAPSAPLAVSALGGDGQAIVSFAAPLSDGDAAITHYTVTASSGGQSASGTGSPITVFGLANGTSYTFTVTATNTVGTGPPSAVSNAVVPTGSDREHPGTPPVAPRPDVPDVAVTAGTHPVVPGH